MEVEDSSRVLANALVLLADAIDNAGVGQAVRQALLPRLEQLGFNWSQAAELATQINSFSETEQQGTVN
jgi:hypothetical protein